jgi:hypothetical protein
MHTEIKAITQKYLGPGGVRCHCCNPFFGKDRKKLNRLIRHKLSSNLRKSLKENNIN